MESQGGIIISANAAAAYDEYHTLRDMNTVECNAQSELNLCYEIIMIQALWNKLSA